MHQLIQPKIHYYGTPVVLISSCNEDGTSNLAPMSSTWWLGQSCVLGLSTRGKTYANLMRERECVLNLATPALVANVDRLALTTGSHPVPDYKKAIGCIHVADKFAHAKLTPQFATRVRATRVAECPIQIEAEVVGAHAVGQPEQHLAAIEVAVLAVHCDEQLLTPGKRHYIDPDKWSPLIMNFLEFYGLSRSLHDSRLAKVF